MPITPNQQEEIVSILCQLLLSSEDSRIRSRAAEALGKLGLPAAIPALCQAVSSDIAVMVRLNAIDALVSIAKPESNPMSDSAKNQPSFQINQVGNLNTGDITIRGDQIGIQHNANLSTELQTGLSEIKTLLEKLQNQNPATTSETEALTIIEAEFTEIESIQAHPLTTLRSQLLNPERHFQATKATLSEVIKHYLEESVWAKAFITYLETMSAEPNSGF